LLVFFAREIAVAALSCKEGDNGQKVHNNNMKIAHYPYRFFLLTWQKLDALGLVAGILLVSGSHNVIGAGA
jgi:hypothetical protein